MNQGVQKKPDTLLAKTLATTQASTLTQNDTGPVGPVTPSIIFNVLPCG